MNKCVLVSLVLIVGAVVNSAQAAVGDIPKVGVDYEVLLTPKKVEGKIEVREFFSYGSKPSYQQSVILKPFIDKLPSDVAFVRTPMVNLEQGNGTEVKVYFALEKVSGKSIDNLHYQILKDSAINGKAALQAKTLSRNIASHGVDLSKFNGIYSSVDVQRKEMESLSLVKQFEIRKAPAIVVNGRYIVKSSSNDTLNTVRYLVKKERKRIN